MTRPSGSRPRRGPSARPPLLLAAPLGLALLCAAPVALAVGQAGWVKLNRGEIKGYEGPRDRPLMVRFQWAGNRLSGKLPLMLVTGFLEPNDKKWGTFRKNYRQLAKRRPVLLLNSAGFGERSDRSHFSMGIADEASVVAAAANKLGVARADVVAHSRGGAVACAVAAKHADKLRIRKLVLVSSVGLSFDMPRMGRWLADDGFKGWAASQLLRFDRVFTNYKRRLYHDPKKLEEKAVAHMLAWLRRPNARRTTRLALRSMLNDIGDAWRRDILSKLTAEEVLVAWGAHDGLIPAKLGHQLAHIVGAPFKLFQRSRHFPMVEQPDEFNDYLTEILEAPVPGGEHRNP